MAPQLAQCRSLIRLRCQALTKPVSAREDYQPRPGNHDRSCRRRASAGDQRQQRRYRQNNTRLTDLDPDIEREQRPAQCRAGQVHFAQNAGKAEAVDKTEAERERRAKVIHAEGELQASEKLFQAAEVLAKEPQAILLRYLETLTVIGAEQNTTIVFPLPMDLLSPFLRKAREGTGNTPPL